VTTEIEEIIVEADGVHAKKLAPPIGEEILHLASIFLGRASAVVAVVGRSA